MSLQESLTHFHMSRKLLPRHDNLSLTSDMLLCETSWVLPSAKLKNTMDSTIVAIHRICNKIKYLYIYVPVGDNIEITSMY